MSKIIERASARRLMAGSSVPISALELGKAPLSSIPRNRGLLLDSDALVIESHISRVLYLESSGDF